MSIYQLLLEYYLSSERYYESYKRLFGAMHNHCGECTEKAQAYLFGKPASRYPFYSAVCYKVYKSEQRATDSVFSRLSDDRIQSYFAKIQDESQLFATIFGYANCLKDAQIAQISALQSEKCCWNILDYFLRSSGSAENKSNALTAPIACIVEIDGKEEPAIQLENTLTLCKNGREFEIL